MREKINALQTMPGRGRVVPELLDIGIRTWRELVIRPHRVIYRVEKDKVYVEVVFDSRRDSEALLRHRLLRR
jgi:toxin ParE1/3/4